jgi:hypothetical protein
MLKFSSERRLSLIALLLTMAFLSGCGLPAASSPLSSPAPSQSSSSRSIKINPSASEVLAGGNQQFSVQISGAAPYLLDPGTNPGTNQYTPPAPTVTWTVNGIPGGNSALGTIDKQGLYSAPVTLPSSGSVKVTALVNASFSATATVTLYESGGHKVNLNWTSVQGYYVYRGGQTGGPYTKISPLASAASYIDNTVKSGQSYYYVVTSYTADSGESAYSNQVEVNIPSTP